MDNQHRKIAGYRELDENEIRGMNDVKEQESVMGEILAEIEAFNKAAGDLEANRWVALARTHLETGFMFALKAIAKPTNGLGRR